MQIFRTQVSVPAQMAPVGMTGDEGYLLDGVSLLEHAGDAFVPQVVGMQICDTELHARCLKALAYGLWMEGEYAFILPRFVEAREHNLPRFAEQGHPLIVSDLSARVFPIPDKNQLASFIDIGPEKLDDLASAHGRSDHEADDLSEFPELFIESGQLVLSRASLAFTASTYQVKVGQ